MLNCKNNKVILMCHVQNKTVTSHRGVKLPLSFAFCSLNSCLHVCMERPKLHTMILYMCEWKWLWRQKQRGRCVSGVTSTAQQPPAPSINPHPSQHSLFKHSVHFCQHEEAEKT